MVDPPARDGRDPDHGLGGFGQGDDPGEQDLPEGRRQPAAGGVLAGPEQLLDEERVAVGAAMDLVGEVAGRRGPEDRRQQRLRLGRVEAAQVDPLDATAALELGQPRQERVAAMQLVGPECHDQHDAVGAELADEEGDGLAGRRIGPMEVLDDEQDRARCPTAAGGRPRSASRSRAWCDSVWRRGRRRGGRAERRHEPGQISGRAVPRTVSSSSASSVRASVRSASTIGPYGTPPSPMSAQPPCRTRIPRAAGHLRRLEDEARLADAGFARDQLVDRGSRDGAVEGPGDGVELRRPSDERRADEAAGHRPMIRACAAVPGGRDRGFHGASLSVPADHVIVRSG